VSPERRWWSNLVRVLHAPRGVFVDLRETEPDDLHARQEPVLLIVLLAGMAGVLATPVAGRLLDSSEYDALLVAVWTFIGGGFYGSAVYLLGGLALWLGVRGMGSVDADWRGARYVLAFACAPVALSFCVILPLRLLAFGGDAFRSGGSDDGAGGTLVWAAQGAFALWALGLLVLGLRVVYGFTWARAAGTFGLVALFLAAMVAVPAAL
jgi:hypothetical protein